MRPFLLRYWPRFSISCGNQAHPMISEGKWISRVSSLCGLPRKPSTHLAAWDTPDGCGEQTSGHDPKSNHIVTRRGRAW